MATDITTITSMPAPVDASTCWECSCPVPNRQAARTLAGWQAVVCIHCEPSIMTLLGPIPIGDIHHYHTD